MEGIQLYLLEVYSVSLRHSCPSIPPQPVKMGFTPCPPLFFVFCFIKTYLSVQTMR